MLFFARINLTTPLSIMQCSMRYDNIEESYCATATEIFFYIRRTFKLALSHSALIVL